MRSVWLNMYKLTGAILWTMGAVLVALDAFVGKLHTGFILSMGFLGVMGLYGFFYGHQRGHRVHFLFVVAFFALPALVFLHFVHTLSNPVIFAIVAGLLMLVAIGVFTYRKSFADDYRAGRRHNFFKDKDRN